MQHIRSIFSGLLQTRLDECARHESDEPFFGDVRIRWTSPAGTLAAEGYFGPGVADVWFLDNSGEEILSVLGTGARKLRECGALAA